MKNKKISLTCGKKKFILPLRVCDEFNKFRGLMFRRQEKAKAILFEFDKPTRTPIHSIFVFFPFIAIWLEGSKIVDIKTVQPFTLKIKPKKGFDKLIEIPINGKYSEIVELLDGDTKDLKT